MSIEVDVLIETYQILKEYVPSKERQEAADTLTAFLVDNLNDEQLKEVSNIDSYMKHAHKEYAVEEVNFDDDDEY
jgi:hypothetical protein